MAFEIQESLGLSFERTIKPLTAGIVETLLKPEGTFTNLKVKNYG